jgi:hypothetical protein
MSTPTNRWQIGAMYFNGLMNGSPTAFFTQPGGVGTQVFPTQYDGPWVDFPISGLVISEYTPWWAPGCGHSIRFWKIIRDYDYDTQMSCALITCSVCSFVQNVYEPFEEYLNPTQHAIIVA